MGDHQQYVPLQQNGWEQHLNDTSDNCDSNTDFEDPKTMKERQDKSINLLA